MEYSGKEKKKRLKEAGYNPDDFCDCSVEVIQ